MYPGEGKRFEFVPCKDQSSDWLELRCQGVGGSDVAAIMGLSPWVGPYEVWCQKTGLVEVPDISDRPAVRWGHLLEPVVATKFPRTRAIGEPEVQVVVEEEVL